jgi:hypothetical protein
MTSATDSDRPGLTRRQALKRGAVVGAAAVWTVPAIQAVSLTSAHADSPSAPPPHNPPPHNPPANPPPTGHTPKPPTHPTHPAHPTPTKSGTTPAGSVPAGSIPGGGAVPVAKTSTGTLANTGLDLPLVPSVAVAAGMIATGIAAQAARSRPEPALQPITEDDPDEQD